MDRDDSLEPIPPTLEAFRLLGDEHDGMEQAARQLAALVRDVVPEVVGVSLSFRDPEVTFTLAVSNRELLPLDGMQYLEGGPCVAAVDDDLTIETRLDDPLSEERWSLFSRAGAHLGVGSSLSVPVHLQGQVVGGLNIYASTANAFEGYADRVAELVQAPAGTAIRDADLTFSTRQQAVETMHTLADRRLLDIAAGLLAEREGIPVDQALTRIEVSAARACVPPVELARLLIHLQGDG